MTAVAAGARVALLHAYRDGMAGEGLLWSVQGGWEPMAPLTCARPQRQHRGLDRDRADRVGRR